MEEQRAGRDPIYSHISRFVEQANATILRASETLRVVPRPNEALRERIGEIVQHLKSKLPKQVVPTNLTFLAGASVA